MSTLPPLLVAPDEARKIIVRGTAEALWTAVGKYNKARSITALERARVFDGSLDPDSGSISPNGEENVEEDEKTHHKKDRKVRKPESLQRLIGPAGRLAQSVVGKLRNLHEEISRLNRSPIFEVLIGQLTQDVQIRKQLKAEIHAALSRAPSDAEFYSEVAQLLVKLSELENRGGRPPNSIFHQAFLEELIPVWETLTGKPLGRDNIPFVDFVSNAYNASTDVEFDAWVGVLRTVLDNREASGKTPVRLPTGYDERS